MTTAHPVSVCVSTRNRSALLPRLLTALATQDADFELVVVDDGSTDDTHAVLLRLAEQVPYPMRVLHQVLSQGPAAGRNAAWEVASGEVIAFTDDDCVPAPTWLSAGLRAMGGAHRIVVGRVSPNPGESHRLDLLAHTLVVGPEQVGWYATANVFYRRADLVEVGGFHTGFRQAACEDTDFGLSVRACGAELVFSPEAHVLHDVTPSTLAARLRREQKWEAIPLLFARHPDERRDLMYLPGVWKKEHAQLLALLAGMVLSLRGRRSVLLGLPWLYRALTTRHDTGGSAVIEVPQLAALELAELIAVVKGSWKNRTLVL